MKKNIITKNDVLEHINEVLKTSSYAVLHGYRKFHKGISSDVDVIGTKITFKLLQELSLKGNLRLVQLIRYELNSYAWIFQIKPVKQTPEFLLFDLSMDIRGFGTIFYEANDLLKSQSLFWNSYPIIAVKQEFTLYVIKKICKSEISEEHSNYLNSLYVQDPKGCNNELRKFFTQNTSSKLCNSAATENWQAITKRINWIKFELFTISLFMHPIRFLSFSFCEIWRIVDRILHPTGLIVSFLGLDGSGKSSIINSINIDLGDVFHYQQSFHLKPSFGKKQNSIPVIDPHGDTPRFWFISILKLLYWWLIYILGWLTRVYPAKIKKSLISFDRFYHDLLVDPRRYRFKNPKKIAFLIEKVIPKPDLFIYLDLPAEIAHRRKPEIPIEEAKALRNKYLCLAHKQGDQAHIVDASEPLDQVVSEVEGIILDYIQKRTISRLHRL